jgi:hypothetical protein
MGTAVSDTIERWREEDAVASYYEAIEIIRQRVAAGEPPPNTGYFAPLHPSAGLVPGGTSGRPAAVSMSACAEHLRLCITRVAA